MTLCSWDRNRTKMAKSIAVSLNTIATFSLITWISPFPGNYIWNLISRTARASASNSTTILWLCMMFRHFPYPQTSLENDIQRESLAFFYGTSAKDFSNSNKFSHGIKKLLWTFDNTVHAVFWFSAISSTIPNRTNSSYRPGKAAIKDDGLSRHSNWHFIGVAFGTCVLIRSDKVWGF